MRKNYLRAFEFMESGKVVFTLVVRKKVEILNPLVRNWRLSDYAVVTISYGRKSNRSQRCPVQIKGRNMVAVRLVSVRRVLMDGPAVSLNGSPIVSPTTDAE